MNQIFRKKVDGIIRAFHVNSNGTSHFSFFQSNHIWSSKPYQSRATITYYKVLDSKNVEQFILIKKDGIYTTDDEIYNDFVTFEFFKSQLIKPNVVQKKFHEEYTKYLQNPDYGSVPFKVSSYLPPKRKKENCFLYEECRLSPKADRPIDKNGHADLWSCRVYHTPPKKCSKYALIFDEEMATQR